MTDEEERGDVGFLREAILGKNPQKTCRAFVNAPQIYHKPTLILPLTHISYQFRQNKEKNHGKNHRKEEKQVIFIDEIAWMDTPRSGFLTAFEHFWNGWASGQHHLMLVTCSSAASWVLDNIINNRGGLYDRTTCEIHLSTFTLKECEQYLLSKDIQLDRYSQALSYMAIGGVPYYLSMIKRGESIAANIDNLFFVKGAKLRNEFDNLFESQFADSDSLYSPGIVN